MAALRDIEQLGRISVAMVRDFGLLKERPNTEIGLRQGEVSVRGVFVSESGIVKLIYSVNGRQITRDVSIVYRDRRFGKRPYFVCPESGNDCLEIILLDGIIASTAFHLQNSRSWSVARLRAAVMSDRLQARIAGKDGRAPARGQNRSKLRNVWARKTLQYRGPKATPSVIAEIVLREKSAAARSPAAGGLSTSYAFAQGYEVSEGNVLFQQYLSRPASWWLETVPSRIDLETPSEKLGLDQVPELSIREIIEWGQPGKAKAYNPGWWVMDTFGQRLTFILDWRCEDRPVFVIRGVFDPEHPRWQRIELTQVRKRWYFTCPANGRCYSALYLREIDFASREAHRLVHVSQLAPARRSKARPPSEV